MEQEKILMGQRELKRWHLMEMVKVVQTYGCPQILVLITTLMASL
jgi:hypothetical protein